MGIIPNFIGLVNRPCLKKDIKKKLNINNYFECIEIADDFFELSSFMNLFIFEYNYEKIYRIDIF